MRPNFILAMALWLVAGNSGLQAASFYCAKAVNPAEKTVCGEKTLSELDEYLGRYYEAARRVLGDGAKCLAADQRQWLKDGRNACGSDKECLASAYYRRLGALHGIQPGVTQLKMDLPHVPVLVTAVPPVGDLTSSAAAGAERLEVIGRLLHENDDPNNMGFAVKPEDGPVRVIVLDMDIGDSPAHEALRYRIEKDATASFIVQGVKGADGGFAMDQCRFVYRRRH